MSKATVFERPVIIMRNSDGDGVRVTEDEMTKSVDAFRAMGLSEDHWSGQDPSGQAYGLAWFTSTNPGTVLAVFEMREGCEEDSRAYALQAVQRIKREILASEQPWESERLSALISNLADEIKDQRIAMRG